MSRPTPGPWYYSHSRHHGFCLQGSNELGGGPVLPILGRTCNFPGQTEANARLIIASCNAIQAAAEKLGEDPIELAERLGNGHLADLIQVGEER